jgi:hypothetical protein
MDTDGINGLPWTPYRVKECIVFSLVFHFTHMSHMIDFSMIYLDGLLTMFLLVDAGLVMHANLTHIRSRGTMHINKKLRETCGSVPV